MLSVRFRPWPPTFKMAPLDSTTVYVFIREDLPLGQDDIQSNHACLHAGMEFAAKSGFKEGIPYMVTVGMPSIKPLNRVIAKLQENNIPHYVMVDTDVCSDPTAVVTWPLDEEQKQVLRNYRLRKYTSGSMDLPPETSLNADAGASLLT